MIWFSLSLLVCFVLVSCSEQSVDPLKAGDETRLNALIKEYGLVKGPHKAGAQAINIKTIDEFERVLKAKRQRSPSARRGASESVPITFPSKPAGGNSLLTFEDSPGAITQYDNGPRRLSSVFGFENFADTGLNVNFNVTSAGTVTNVTVYANVSGFAGAEITTQTSNYSFYDNTLHFNLNVTEHTEFTYLIGTLHHYDYVNANITANYNTQQANYHVIDQGDRHPQ